MIKNGRSFDILVKQESSEHGFRDVSSSVVGKSHVSPLELGHVDRI